MRLFLTFFLAGLSQEIEPFQYEQYDYEYSNSLDRDLINIRGFIPYIFFEKISLIQLLRHLKEF